MAKFGLEWFTVFAVSVVAVLSRSVDGERKHFYATQENDLRWLANVDFELAKQLQNLKETVEPKLWKSWPLFKTVEK